MNKLSKNIIALSLATTLVLPMTGCNANLTIGGKEIFNLKDNKVTEEFDKFGKQTTHTDEEAVNAIINGNYTITYNNQDFTVPMVDVLNTLFPNCEIATQPKDENTWLVKFQSGNNYIVYRMSFLTGTLVEQELCYNGTTLTETNDEAHNGILQLIVTQIIDNGGYATNDNNQSESTLKCKHCGKEYKKSKSDASEPDKYCSSGCNTEASMLEKKAKEEKAQKKDATDFDDRELQKNLCTCKHCGKKYDPKESNSWENTTYCSKSCQVAYEEAQASKKEEKYKYFCAWCGKGYRPDSSNADDNYSFCSQGCEAKWYEDQQKVVDDYNNGIDHSACKNCGKEIGLNGYQGYCYDCAEDLGIGR